MSPLAFLDKKTAGIDFADEAVAQCNVLFIKILLLGDNNLQMITNKF